jgi:hypothetical protein
VISEKCPAVALGDLTGLFGGHQELLYSYSKVFALLGTAETI